MFASVCVLKHFHGSRKSEFVVMGDGKIVHLLKHTHTYEYSCANISYVRATAYSYQYEGSSVLQLKETLWEIFLPKSQYIISGNNVRIIGSDFENCH